VAEATGGPAGLEGIAGGVGSLVVLTGGDGRFAGGPGNDDFDAAGTESVTDLGE
jgi:hypothetical protein